eukprot:763641-Hanusia_phi.AAC.3
MRVHTDMYKSDSTTSKIFSACRATCVACRSAVKLPSSVTLNNTHGRLRTGRASLTNFGSIIGFDSSDSDHRDDRMSDPSCECLRTFTPGCPGRSSRAGPREPLAAARPGLELSPSLGVRSDSAPGEFNTVTGSRSATPRRPPGRPVPTVGSDLVSRLRGGLGRAGVQESDAGVRSDPCHGDPAGAARRRAGPPPIT